MDEDACIAQRLEQARTVSQRHDEAAALAAQLIEGARKKVSRGLDAFLATYGLNTEEGIALMCLGEALLRIPDQQTLECGRSAIKTRRRQHLRANRLPLRCGVHQQTAVRMGGQHQLAATHAHQGVTMPRRNR